MPTPPTDEPDSVSVVIPSYRRRGWLIRTLDCLAAQTRPPDQAIVLDASPDEEALSDADVRTYPGWLSYRRWHPHGNVSRQRNAALRDCRGEVVLFLDDDVEFGPTLVQDYLDAFRETRADGVSGLVLIPGESVSNLPKIYHPTALLYPGGPNYQAFDGVVETHVICTASFAVTREAVLAVGGFDEQMNGTLDDVELGLRLVKAGYRIVHHNGPRVLHFMAGSSGSRSPELGVEWRLTNFFYFQYRHFWARRRALVVRSLWYHCRPSRDWLRPREIRRRWRSVVAAHHAATRKADEGPLLLSGAAKPVP